MQTTRIVTASTLALGLEMVGLIPLSQPPTNPPNPIPPVQPSTQPTPRTPRQQPPAQLPNPNLPARGTDPNNVNQPNPAAASRANRPFAFQTPQAEVRFNENTRRLALMEQRLEQSNQELLRRLGEIRQLSGERQNAAFMDLLQQLLQNNAEMHRYLVFARTGWTGSPDEEGEPLSNQPAAAVPDSNQQPR